MPANKTAAASTELCHNAATMASAQGPAA